MIGTLITGVIGVAIFVAWVAWEDHDKSSRALRGLPARKYHDINDYDVQTVFIHEVK